MRIELSQENYDLTSRLIRDKLGIDIQDNTYISIRSDSGVEFSMNTAEMGKSEIVRKVRSLVELYGT